MPDSLIEQLRRMPQRRDEIWQRGMIRTRSWVGDKGSRPDRTRLAISIALSADIDFDGRMTP